MIYIRFVELEPCCYRPRFKILGLCVVEKKIFKGSYHKIILVYMAALNFFDFGLLYKITSLQGSFM